AHCRTVACGPCHPDRRLRPAPLQLLAGTLPAHVGRCHDLVRGAHRRPGRVAACDRGAGGSMNLLEAMELDAPATVTLTGPIVKGDVHVRHALASDLSRTIRFGTDNFSNADIVKVRGVESELAGLYFAQRDGAWNRVGFAGIRRPDSYKSEVPAKTWKVIIE